ncbi:MAG: PilZ domain-containing protein, partial [Streptosporangiaceae bacterium]
FKIMMISGPLVYWWTGTSVMTSTLGELTYWLGPSALAGTTVLMFYSELRVLPVMTDAMQLLPAFVVVCTVATGLVRPFGRPFEVTAKGLSSEHVTVHWGLLLPFAALAAATMLWMIVNLPAYSPLHGAPGYEVNVVWSLFNIAVLLITASACVELPKRRSEERFVTDEPAELLTEAGIQVCRVANISVSGARIRVPGGWQIAGREGVVAFNGGDLRAPFVLITAAGDTAAIQFATDAATRRALIVKLFTGAYHNEVGTVRPGAIAKAVLRKVLY